MVPSRKARSPFGAALADMPPVALFSASAGLVVLGAVLGALLSLRAVAPNLILFLRAVAPNLILFLRAVAPCLVLSHKCLHPPVRVVSMSGTYW